MKAVLLYPLLCLFGLAACHTPNSTQAAQTSEYYASLDPVQKQRLKDFRPEAGDSLKLVLFALGTPAHAREINGQYELCYYRDVRPGNSLKPRLLSSPGDVIETLLVFRENVLHSAIQYPSTRDSRDKTPPEYTSPPPSQARP